MLISLTATGNNIDWVSRGVEKAKKSIQRSAQEFVVRVSYKSRGT